MLFIDTMRFEHYDFDIRNKLIILSQQLINDDGMIIIVLPTQYLLNNKYLTDKIIIKVVYHYNDNQLWEYAAIYKNAWISCCFFV
jgi:hypothetical protein